MTPYPQSVTEVDLERFRVPRPRRADGARNFDAVVAAAREVFLTDGADTPLELVAERAGVGIATLYRNFPTRETLLVHLYIGEIQEILADAASVEALEPWEGMQVWVRRFVEHLGNKGKLGAAVKPGTDVYEACSAGILGAAGPVIERARANGDLRGDVMDQDVTRAVQGIAMMEVDSKAQRRHILEIFLDGLAAVRAHP